MYLQFLQESHQVSCPLTFFGTTIKPHILSIFVNEMIFIFIENLLLDEIILWDFHFNRQSCCCYHSSIQSSKFWLVWNRKISSIWVFINFSVTDWSVIFYGFSLSLFSLLYLQSLEPLQELSPNQNDNNNHIFRLQDPLS